MILTEILRAASFYPNQCKISWLKDLSKINQPNHFGRSLGTLQIQSVATILEHCFFYFFLNQPKYIYIALFNQKSMHTITNLQIKPGQTINHISSVMAGKFFFKPNNLDS
jgi:hypothetical protein